MLTGEMSFKLCVPNTKLKLINICSPRHQVSPNLFDIYSRSLLCTPNTNFLIVYLILPKVWGATGPCGFKTIGLPNMMHQTCQVDASRFDAGPPHHRHHVRHNRAGGVCIEVVEGMSEPNSLSRSRRHHGASTNLRARSAPRNVHFENLCFCRSVCVPAFAFGGKGSER